MIMNAVKMFAKKLQLFSHSYTSTALINSQSKQSRLRTDLNQLKNTNLI